MQYFFVRFLAVESFYYRVMCNLFYKLVFYTVACRKVAMNLKYSVRVSYLRKFCTFAIFISCTVYRSGNYGYRKPSSYSSNLFPYSLLAERDPIANEVLFERSPSMMKMFYLLVAICLLSAGCLEFSSYWRLLSRKVIFAGLAKKCFFKVRFLL